ncbi:MAG: chemotaxis protein CheA, partial [Defluviitaleaceae bacterium]|nr:chemotaxis protein CheA [Defluviitaleaceae bacterium]
MADFDRDSVLEMFTFEMGQLLEQLEQILIKSETGYATDEINEIFRIMHTIKGSAAMMNYNSVSSAAHSVEDLFYYLREESPRIGDYASLTDIVLAGTDFIKEELAKVEAGDPPDGDNTEIVSRIKQYLALIKAQNGSGPDAKRIIVQKTGTTAPEAAPAAGHAPNTRQYACKVMFIEGSEMENIRAYTLVHNLGNLITDVSHTPADLMDEEVIGEIRKNGFLLDFSSEADLGAIKQVFEATPYIRDYELKEAGRGGDSPALDAATEASGEAAPFTAKDESKNQPESEQPAAKTDAQADKKGTAHHVISVNVSKLDQLLNLMGELVISEAMVTQNSELQGLELDSFNKETRQLRKIISDLQETVMTMRMVSLSTTFFKMHRIVHDMCRQLGKDVQLEVVGEDTEVDKNIIEHISDPIMHIIRNSVDHGIEMPEEREKLGKDPKGAVILEAKNTGGDVLIIIRDDGAGLNREKILKKAKNNGLLKKPESEYTDREIQQFIFLPGFSTNETVTSYSGRGVGMDVVSTNLEIVGGSVSVDSTPGEGSVFTLKIPLTLAIIEGMTIKMGGAKFTIPIVSIRTSFKVSKDTEIFADPDGNEMVSV